MDYAVVTSVLGIVQQQLLEKPHSCLINLSHHHHNTQIIIESLSDNLRFLQAYLQESDPEAQKVLHQGIRDVAAEAEDKIESKLSDVYLAADKGDHAAIEAACEDLHHTLQQVAKDIESVEERIRDLQIRHYTASLHDVSSPSLQLQKISSSSKYELEPENVDDDEFNKIKTLLINWRSEQRTVISIVGKREGGASGKTELAKRLYHHPSILSHFEIQAWTTVSQEFSNEKAVLIDLLGCIMLLTSEITNQTTHRLEDLLYQSLKHQRYLIVIDDVWAIQAWDDIRMCFPDDSNGSRILITTPMIKVAEYATSSTNKGECLVEVHSTSFDGSSTSPLNLENITNNSPSLYDLELDNTMVGLEDEIVKIRDALIHQHSSPQREVISIVGMGGSGKTTLARRVYDDPFIVSHFDIRGRVVASQNFSEREVLIRILHRFGLLTGDFSKCHTPHLKQKLYQSLKGQRYLIVIDNIWGLEDWNDFQECFPDDSNGSRILITTRTMQVAEHVSSSNKCIYHKRFLTSVESWNLFVTKVFGRERYHPSPKLDVSFGRRIVEKCGGSPLAINVVAGLLAKENSPKSWEDIDKHLEIILDSKDSSSGIIAFSYNTLLRRLQVCLLYFAIFPKGSVIDVKKLMRLWVAEGFLMADMHKSLEEVALNALSDLINRGLVVVAKQRFYRKVKYCKLDDLIHDFCFKKIQEENTLVVSNEYQDDLATGTWSGAERSQLNFRWISCQSRHWPVTQSSSLSYSASKIRSILHFGKGLYLAKCRFIFPCLKLLRVLDLSLIRYWKGLPSEIVNLIHLRYLALTTIGSLYNFQLFKLQNLQTLILFSWMEESHLQLPCDVLDLPWLRHVHLDKGSSLYLPNLIQENIQTLFWLKVASWDTKTPDFTRVPNLKELGIYMEGEISANDLDSLTQLHQLEKLKFEMGRVEHYCLPISFPPSIKKLTLRNTYIPWKEMDIIAKLPNLEILKLKDFAFCGPEWEPIDGGFPRLKFLLIAHLDLEYWNANEDHFPVLECLVLKCCWYLEDLPIGFAGIFTLRLIELIDCCPSLVTSAKEISKLNHVLGSDLLVRHFLTEDESPKNESSREDK